jgi:hypothetical protein
MRHLLVISLLSGVVALAAVSGCESVEDCYASCCEETGVPRETCDACLLTRVACEPSLAACVNDCR